MSASLALLTSLKVTSATSAHISKALANVSLCCSYVLLRTKIKTSKKSVSQWVLQFAVIQISSSSIYLLSFMIISFFLELYLIEFALLWDDKLLGTNNW